MPAENYYQGIKHIVTISTDESLICEECKTSLTKNDLSGIVNHYIEQHKYKILHIGQQTDKTGDGEIFHLTVAVIGK